MKKIWKRVAAAALFTSLSPATGMAAPSLQGPSHRDVDLPLAADAQGLPAVPARGRYILVDTTSARLFMFEDGQIRDSMRVIVGKPSAATPNLTGTVYYATLNPYWHVPMNLTRTNVAPRVLKEGASYLKRNGYEIVSGFSTDAEIIPAGKVDWKAVASGRRTVYVRQRPGPANFMGRVKFNFGSAEGIFLHDTPSKDLFERTDRRLSNGCIRLEDATRLAHWLMGRDLTATSGTPDDNVALPSPVPVTITALDGSQAMHFAALR